MSSESSARRIQVSLSLEEAEALLAFVSDGAGAGVRAHDFEPRAFLRARTKLIEKLLALPGYRSPIQREYDARRPKVTA